MSADCIDNAQVIQATMNFRRGERQFQNVFWFSKDSSIGGSDLAGVMNGLADWWVNSYRTMVCNDVVLDNIEAKQWTAGGLDAVAPCLTNCAGTVTANPLPASVSATLSWKTALRGRRNRGRTYVQGIDEPSVDDNDLLTSLYMAQLAAAATYLLSVSWPSGIHRIIYHCKDGDYTNVLLFTVDQNPDSQRRRLPGRGI